ncbi:MAG: zinc ribbon domain-containing protein [Planctomycetaceae bacterium]|nr:zinc ribbon domain-containing protein [Planctomycetaceae bacterium]
MDQEYATPHGQPCEACGCPIEGHDKFCPACGASQVVEATVVVDEPNLQKFFRCDNCGSEVATDPEQRSYVCPFCDSTYVVEFSPEQTDRQSPEFIIGFAVTSDQAQEKFRTWIADNGWFRPGDLRTAAIADKQKGVYLPFWSFSMLAQSRWSARIGEYWYRTETYTTTDSKGNTTTHTRQVRETEWWPLNGKHHHYYAGFLVSGSRGLPQSQAERIKPFNLPALRRYEPYFLAGWLAEEYSIARDQALQLCQQEFYLREQRNVATFLPGDTHSGLQVSSNFSNVNSDLCLLPVYVLSYRYQKKLYRFLVNGQTGKIAGDKPLSWKRIAAMVVGVLIVIGIVVLIGVVVSQHG